MSTVLTLAAPAAFAPAARALAARYADATGVKVNVLLGPASGGAANSVVSRLSSHPAPDVALLPVPLLDTQIAAGMLVTAGRVDVGQSLVALCVMAGAPRPAVAAPEALRATLLGARSIGISALASGVFFRETLLARLGLSDTVGPRCQVITDGPVGQAVAQGRVEMGVQQWSELLQQDGIEILDPLPDGFQGPTMIAAAASPTGAARAPVAAFLRFLVGPEAAGCLYATGLSPVPADRLR